MADKLHRIKVVISTDASGALDVTKRVGQNLKTFGDLWSQAGRAAVIASTAANAALLGLALAGAKAAEEIGATARRLGDATESIQAIGFAAQQSETDMAAVTTAMRSLSVQAFQAATGNEEAAVAFDRLGVSVRDTNDQIKSASTLFREVVDRLSGIDNSTTRVALAQDLLGRSAIQLGSFIANGTTAIDAAAKTLQILNATADETTTTLGDQMGDAVNVARQAVTGLSFALVRALGPAVVDNALKIAAAVAELTKWVDANRDLVRRVAEATVKVLIAATAFFAAAKGAAALGSLLSGLATFLRGPFGVALIAVTALLTFMGVVISKLFDSLTEFADLLAKIGDTFLRLGQIFAMNPIGRSINFMADGLQNFGRLLIGIADKGKAVDKEWQTIKKTFDELKAAFENFKPQKVETIVETGTAEEVDKAAEAVKNLQAALAGDAAGDFQKALKDIFDLGGKIDFVAVKEALRETQQMLDRGDPAAAVQVLQRAQQAAIDSATQGASILERASEAIGRSIAQASQSTGGAGDALRASMEEVAGLIEEAGKAGNTTIVETLEAIQADLRTQLANVTNANIQELQAAFTAAQAKLDQLSQQASTLERGSIDIKNRPVVEGPDGTVSTVRSMSVNIDGVEVLVPTVSDAGKLLSNQAAIDAFLATGAHLGKFLDAQSATNYAQALHEQQAAMVALIAAQQQLTGSIDPDQLNATLDRAMASLKQLRDLQIKPEDILPDSNLIDFDAEEQRKRELLSGDTISQRAEDDVKMLALRARGITNEVELAADTALKAVGSFSKNLAQTIVQDFTEIGDVIGSFVFDLVQGVDALQQLATQNRIAELHASLAGTVEEQARWNAIAEQTQRQMDALELSALENQNAWTNFWKSMRQWAANLLADITALIAKMAILKALSSIGPFGSLFDFFGLKLKEGGFIPKMAGGGFVHGGVWGRDSVPALLAPGELVVPADQTDDFLSRFGTRAAPITVNLTAGLLAGDKGTAREMVRMIQEELRFLETGATI